VESNSERFRFHGMSAFSTTIGGSRKTVQVGHCYTAMIHTELDIFAKLSDRAKLVQSARNSVSHAAFSHLSAVDIGILGEPTQCQHPNRHLVVGEYVYRTRKWVPSHLAHSSILINQSTRSEISDIFGNRARQMSQPTR
jgi:hypothetical protein